MRPVRLGGAGRQERDASALGGGTRAYFGFPADASASEGEERFRALAEIFAAAARDLLAAG